MLRTQKAADRSSSRRPATVIAALVVVFVVVVVGMAVAFANASSAARIADNATMLHWTNATQGSTALARAATGQAVLFGVGLDAGVASEEDLAIAISEAVEALYIVKQWTEQMPSGLAADDPELRPLLDEFHGLGLQIIGEIRSNEFDRAEALRTEGLEPIYADVRRQIDSNQLVVTDLIAASEDSAKVVADTTTLVVTLLIPAAAIVTYWLIARRQLRESRFAVDAKLEAQRELVAGVSHELRTPLSAIYGFSELILAGEAREESVEELVRLINTESADLSRMVDDLLTAARLDSGDLTFVPGEFSPLEAILSVGEPFRRAGHDFVLDCEPGTIVTDETRFRQVLRNLLSNAFRHGGSIVKVIATRSLDGVRLAVMDNGAGLSGPVVDRLFEPFANRGAKALLVGSVGLGLSVSRASARAMGGDLTYSRAHGWTVFTLTLPAGLRSVVDYAPSESAPPRVPAASPGT